MAVREDLSASDAKAVAAMVEPLYAGVTIALGALALLIDRAGDEALRDTTMEAAQALAKRHRELSSLIQHGNPATSG